MLILTGCQTPAPVVIPADKQVQRLSVGQPFTPAVPGWFVPDARMYEILNRLDAAK